MRNFVFDLYGTLVDIHTDETGEKFKKAVAKYFCRADFWEEYLRLCAEADTGEENCEIDLSAVFKTLLNGADDKKVAEAAKFFREKSRTRLKVYRGVYSLLQALKDGGGRLFILSNAQACFTLDELKTLKLTEYFDGISLSSEFGKKKPAKEFFLSLLKKYGLSARETVYIGNDYRADIFGAKAAGLSTAYIKSNLSPEGDEVEEISKASDYATESFEELSEYLIAVLG